MTDVREWFIAATAFFVMLFEGVQAAIAWLNRHRKLQSEARQVVVTLRVRVHEADVQQLKKLASEPRHGGEPDEEEEAVLPVLLTAA
jgi:hypothetical protein